MDTTKLKEAISDLLMKLPDDTDWKTLRHEFSPLITAELKRRLEPICIFCEESEAKLIKIGNERKIKLMDVKRMILKGTMDKYKINTIKPYLCDLHLKEKDVIKICEIADTLEKATDYVKTLQFEYFDVEYENTSRSIHMCIECREVKVCKDCLQNAVKGITEGNYSQMQSELYSKQQSI